MADNYLLPEDLASVMTPAQAADRLHKANAAYIRAQRGGTVPRAVGLEMTDARKALADAMRRDREMQQGYEYDSFGQDIQRNLGNAWDAIKGIPAHTVGFFRDMNDMVPGPLKSPLGAQLPSSREVGEAMGADVDNPGFTIAGLASPMPNELKAAGTLAGTALASTLAYMKIASKAGGVTPDAARMFKTMRGGPLLHASPYKFDFFDPAHLGKGEGFQAYSPGGFYFSEPLWVPGSTHPGYLAQFGRHPELPITIQTPSREYELVDLRASGDRAEQHLNQAAEITADLRASGTKVSREHVSQALFDVMHSGDVDDAIKRVEQYAFAHPTNASFALKEIEALRAMKVSKGQPYSYKIEVADEVKDNLPIFEVPIGEQPAKYRGAVERVAKENFDSWASVVRTEIDELQGAIETWEDFMSGLQKRDPAIEDVIREHKARIKQKEKDLARGFNPRQTFGELVTDLKATYGDEAAQRMLYDAGIPGSRNRTYQTRRALASPIGAMKSLLGKGNEAYNYAMWDMDQIDEVVRYKTKDGKILYDTAETVYKRVVDEQTGSISQRVGPKEVRSGGRADAVKATRNRIHAPVEAGQPPAFRRNDPTDSQLDLSFDLADDLKPQYQEYGLATPRVVQVTDPQRFYTAISEAKKTSPIMAQVTAKTPEEYANMRLFLTEDGTAGFALDGEDVVSLFNAVGGPHDGVSHELVMLAVNEGGRTLDNYDTFLRPLYERMGFKEYERYPWDESQMPDDWDKAFFKDFNNGEPDYVFMRYEE